MRASSRSVSCGSSRQIHSATPAFRMPRISQRSRRAKARRQQQGRDRGGGGHEQRVHDVQGRDRARPRRLVAAALDDRVERHDEQAAADRDQGQIDKDAQPGKARQERDDAEQFASRRRNRRHAGQREVERKDRHAERRERHVAGADLALHQPPAQHRADPDPDRERGEEQGHDAGAGAQRLLRESRDLRQEHRADQPEPRGAEDRQLDGAAAPRRGAGSPRSR